MQPLPGARHGARGSYYDFILIYSSQPLLTQVSGAREEAQAIPRSRYSDLLCLTSAANTLLREVETESETKYLALTHKTCDKNTSFIE